MIEIEISDKAVVVVDFSTNPDVESLRLCTLRVLGAGEPVTKSEPLVSDVLDYQDAVKLSLKLNGNYRRLQPTKVTPFVTRAARVTVLL